ncbi:recombinase family protein [Streptomyces griseorubiginosus]|uniref:recombinase family protein n=1 Tax=Streptomyces griseorubiginosus TaxID=67304 RepID=UPI0036E5D641
MPFAPEYLHLVFSGVRFEALLYGRNSDDAGGGGSSVEDQLANGRTLCRDNDWRVVQEFNDTDLSASRHARKARGDFETLLANIVNEAPPAGVRRIVVAYEASRYYRDLEAYVRLRNACMATDTLLCYDGQVYDLSRRDDRKATALHAVDAEDEAEGIRNRNLRTMRRTASEGMPHGKAVYGYTRTYEVVNGRRRCTGQIEDEVQGAYVVELLERADAGHSLKALARWISAEPRAARHDGKPWTVLAVRRVILNRTYLGERLHKGQYVQAVWAPLKGLDTPEGRALFNRVNAKIKDPARNLQRGTDPVHLLSYIALCGECGDHALLHWLSPGKRRSPSLYCGERRDTSIAEELIDAYVEEAVLNWFSDKGKARAALVPADDSIKKQASSLQKLINAYEEQLSEARELAGTFDEEAGRFKMPAASLASLESQLGPKLEAAKKKVQGLAGVSPVLLRLLESKDPELVWNGSPDAGDEGLTMEQKRQVIREVVTVRLYKATVSGRRPLEEGRIRLSFFGEPGFRDRPLRVPVSVPVQGGPAAAGVAGPAGTG